MKKLFLVFILSGFAVVLPMQDADLVSPVSMEQQQVEHKNNKTIYEKTYEKYSSAKKSFYGLPSFHKKIIITMIVAGVVEIVLQRWLHDLNNQKEESFKALCAKGQDLYRKKQESERQAKLLDFLID